MTSDESSVESGAADVLRYETDRGPVYRAAPAGEGEAVVAAHEAELHKRRQFRRVLGGVVALGMVGYGVATGLLAVGALGAAAVVAAFYVAGDTADEVVPELVEQNQFRRDAEREYELEGS
jgi:hypothetical protein